MKTVPLPHHSQTAARRCFGLYCRALLIGAFLLFVTGIGLTRLVFSHTPVDTLVSNAYAVAIVDDPAHAGLYGDAYGIYRAATGANLLHYAVHRVAARLAAATGHPQAAQTQALRARQHDVDWLPARALRGTWRWLRDGITAHA